MNTFQVNESISPAYGHAFTSALSMKELQHWAPAIFAESACATTKPTYRFINTAQVLGALKEAGFEPSSAQQTHIRHPMRMNHSRHMIRLRPIRQTITLFDCIPEICLVNAHDGTSASCSRDCTGRCAPMACCVEWGISRSFGFRTCASVIAGVVAGAIKVTAQFERIGSVVEAMAQRILTEAEQLALAQTAYEIRWASVASQPALQLEKMLSATRDG